MHQRFSFAPTALCQWCGANAVTFDEQGDASCWDCRSEHAAMCVRELRKARTLRADLLDVFREAQALA